MKLAQRMSRLGTETAFEVLAKAQKLEAQGKKIIHLTTNQISIMYKYKIAIVGSGNIALKHLEVLVKIKNI